MNAAVATAGLLGIAAALVAPARPAGTATGRLLGRPSRSSTLAGPLARPLGGRAAGPVLGAVAVAVWWLVGAAHFMLAAIAAFVALGVARLLARARAARQADGRAARVLAACDGMAADLAAGQPPRAALRRAAAEWPELEPAAVAAELDSDVPAALRHLAAAPGAAQLRTVAAAWQVAHRSGTGLAGTLARIAVVVREEQRTSRLVATELAAARATARMMAALPALVLLLGAGIGGDPVGFLLDTPVGLGCLAAGVALTQLGLVWLERIADAVQGRR